MYILDLEQIGLIESLVEKEELHYSHLKEDMVDHICCDIEVLMDSGMKFREALNIVKREIGIGGLKKIQESTLFLIDKNYRQMKKTMRIFGLVAPTLIALGGLFKIQHWPGAGIMLTLGAVLLSFVFLPSALYVMYRETKSKKRIFVYVTGFLGGFGYILGVLFKIQHWPGAGVLLTLGLGILSLAFLPSLLISKCLDEPNKKMIPVWIIAFSSIFLWVLGMLFKIMHWPGASIMLLIGTLSVVVLAIPLYYLIALRPYSFSFVRGSFIFLVIAITEILLTGGLMRLNMPADFQYSFVDTEINLKVTIDYLEAKNTRFYAMETDSSIKVQMAQIKEKSNDLDNYIQDLKIKLVNYVEGENAKNVIKDGEIKSLYIQDKSEIKKSDFLLVGDNRNGIAFELKEKLLTYKEFIGNYLENKNVADIINTTNLPVFEGKEMLWEEVTFTHISLLAKLNRLSLIQRDLRYAETQAITSLHEKSLVETQNL